MFPSRSLKSVVTSSSARLFESVGSCRYRTKLRFCRSSRRRPTPGGSDPQISLAIFEHGVHSRIRAQWRVLSIKRVGGYLLDSGDPNRLWFGFRLRFRDGVENP